VGSSLLPRRTRTGGSLKRGTSRLYKKKKKTRTGKDFRGDSTPAAEEASTGRKSCREATIMGGSGKEKAEGKGSVQKGMSRTTGKNRLGGGESCRVGGGGAGGELEGMGTARGGVCRPLDYGKGEPEPGRGQLTE